ncbi:MAG: GTP-binding protein EngB [Candidatus Thorarchaeota archaeon]
MNARNRSGTDSDKPLVVFAGRSNVGKSSTIRALTGKKVVVGKHPGSTRWEKMFDFGSISIVDIPGFGFMRGKSKTSIEEMKVTIIQKLEGWSEQLALAVLILDLSLFRELTERWAKRGEIPIDIEFYTFLSEIAPEVIVVANKIDKLKNRELDADINYLYSKLEEAIPAKKPTVVITSAPRRIGMEDLKQLIEDILSKRGIEKPNW